MATTITLTTREAAHALGVSIRTAQRRAQTGKLQAIKQSGRWQITITAPTLADFKPATVDKARDAIETGAILPTSRHGMYTAVSSDGSTTYLVHASGCTCPAGQRGRHLCYHRAAVQILSATRHAA